MNERQFPLLFSRSRDLPDLKSIPYEMIEPHEAQAKRNHDQTLQRLAARGGLSPSEACAVLLDRRFQMMPEQEAIDQLKQMIAAFREKKT